MAKTKTKPAKTPHRHALVPPWMHTVAMTIAKKTGVNMTDIWQQVCSGPFRREWAKHFPNTPIPGQE